MMPLNINKYLVDVGFGASFHEPLLLETGIVQKDVTEFFKIEKYNDNYLCLYRSNDGVNYLKIKKMKS